MIDDSLKQQIDQWLDDDLSNDDQLCLKKALESTPEAIHFLRDRALLHQMLTHSVAIDTSLIGTGLIDSVQPAPRQPKRWIAQQWFWATSSVIACLLCISLLRLPSVEASAAELVRRALAEYQPTTDRRYTVQVETEAPLRRNTFRRRAVPAASTLWVRGKMFVQLYDSQEEKLAWGKNSQGSVWFAISGRSAAVFQAGEIPEPLQDVCDLRILQLPMLLESLLKDFDLEYSKQADGIATIVAHPHSETSNSKYGTIELEIDRNASLVRRVTMERLNDKRPVAIVRFALEEIEPREQSLYELESHLQPGAEVFDRGARRGKRSELLREFFQKLRAQPTPKS
jgi:hypothetical protein